MPGQRARQCTVVRDDGAKQERPEDGVHADRFGAERRHQQRDQGDAHGTLRRLLATLRRMRQPLEARLHHQEHGRDERDREHADEDGVVRRAIHDTDRKGQKTPGGDIVDRRAVSASAPSFVCVMRWSARMRASTGNAVIDIATPRNSAKCVNGTSLVEAGIEKRASSEPRTNGARCSRARSPRWRARRLAQLSGVQLETDEEHVQDHARAERGPREGRDRAAAEIGDAPGATRPSSEGPRRMPATTSPITGGCHHE